MSSVLHAQFVKVVAKPKKKRPSPLSLRLSEEERAQLQHDAGSLAVGTYIRKKLFGDDIRLGKSHRRKHRRPSMDHEQIAKFLGILGQSELGPSLIAIAMAAETGSLPVSPELTDELHQACDNVRTMRSVLIRALGIKSEERP
ncbi:hypothetical protein [Sneathiella sp.]|uniref:hypothetical protein n=1 Tax=Sneathiella sp. TaxID=1964365 RepID=UPI002614B856|nr:hypothetical protein [Sneathiella sp.]MDF2368877.1 hypothetical protein [Sneathiella sp.]